MSQRASLQNLIIDFCNKRESRTFSLKEFIQEYNDFQIIGIGGKTPQATVRRLLQELRDLEFLSFRDYSGNYTLQGIDLLEKEKQDISRIDLSRERPNKREYLLETYVRNVRWAHQAKEILGDRCLCKNCNNSFITESGYRYIEVHHIVPLHEQGEDRIWNLAVLCAHHHRMAHFAEVSKKKKMEEYLLREVACRI